MALVEGLRSSDRRRWCATSDCLFELQLVAQFYGGEDLTEPTEFSHLGPYCPVCVDRIEKGELNGRDPARASVD